MENNLKILKIPIESLLTLLEMLYEQGFDYVDLEGSNDPEQDTLLIYTKSEYMSEDNDEEEYEDEDEEEFKNIPPKNVKLSDEDIDKLI